ncbi:MAG: cytochrome c3 family protein [Planctomycetota bacterium]|jgi:predicted CXXCH cytochrome family protein
MKDVQEMLTKVLLLVCSLAVLFVLAYAAYEENFAADWYRHQSEYKRRLLKQAATERERQAAERFDVGQKQLYLPALSRIDRCVTCHVSIDNPGMKDSPQPLTAHSGDIMLHHPKEQFGCTICHEGQGRATTAADAHGHVDHWPTPMLAQEQLDQSCPKCHTDRWLPDVPRYSAAMDVFYEHGCLSCHKLRGRGGDIGPDITSAGLLHDAEWHFKHFKDPKSVVETSEMPNDNLSDEQARRLTFLMMCYRGESIPTGLLSNPTREVVQMTLPEPLDPLALEGFVGSQYCIGCHGATHPGTVETWRESKMTSTYERIMYEPTKDNCLPCHSTGLNSETGHYVEEGVGCEACHGPGREAVRLVLAGKTNEHKEMIRIDRNSEPACERCHNPHVPTGVHAEFYRKLPPRAAQQVTTTMRVEEDLSAVIEPELAPISLLHATVAEPPAEEEPPSVMEHEPSPAVGPTPATAETSVEGGPPVARETEPGLPVEPQPTTAEEPVVAAEGETAPASQMQENAAESVAESDLPASMEAEPNVLTVSQPIITEQPLASGRRDTNLPAVLPDALVPQVTAMLQMDIFPGAPATRPPEKIEGGCVSSTCHSATVLGEVIHGPTAQQECEACHLLVDEPSHKFKLPSKEPDLCFECHDPSPTHEFQHGPVALGVCTVCHNPHGGPEEFMLPATGNSLCFVCHTEMSEYVHSVQIEHDVIGEEGCAACHDPHASDFNGQLKNDMSPLCMECHEEVGEIIEKAVVAHEPVTTDSKCANCHEPHGGDVPRLLVDQEVNLCLDCHDEPMETPNGSIINMKAWIENNPEHHGPIREGNCTLCHQPHGSQHFRILAYEFPRKFYSPFSIEVYDLCFQCHEDTLVLDELTTALTDFRNGDKNLHYVHVNQERGRTCRACHEVHAGTKPKRMKDFVPFGTWMYPVNFELTTEGGKCAPGCHLARGYDRKQAITQR